MAELGKILYFFYKSYGRKKLFSKNLFFLRNYIFHHFLEIPAAPKFRYTIGKALKNAIIGDIFVGQAKGTVQKRRFFV
jgi:hypothetical protein